MFKVEYTFKSHLIYYIQQNIVYVGFYHKPLLCAASISATLHIRVSEYRGVPPCVVCFIAQMQNRIAKIYTLIIKSAKDYIGTFILEMYNAKYHTFCVEICIYIFMYVQTFICGYLKANIGE